MPCRREAGEAAGNSALNPGESSEVLGHGWPPVPGLRPNFGFRFSVAPTEPRCNPRP